MKKGKRYQNRKKWRKRKKCKMERDVGKKSEYKKEIDVKRLKEDRWRKAHLWLIIYNWHYTSIDGSVVIDIQR